MSNLIRGKFQSFTNNGKTKINCLVSIVFLVATVWFNFNIGRNHKNSNFINTLTNHQKLGYEKIVNERFNLAMQGYGLGFLLSFIIYKKIFFYFFIIIILSNNYLFII